MTEWQSRVSFNINAAVGFDAQRRQYLMDVINAWKPRVVLVMNAYNPNDAGNIVVQIVGEQAKHGGKVIYRHYSEREKELWKHGSGRDYAKWLRQSFGNEVIHHYMNEPAPGQSDSIRDMCAFLADVVEYSLENDMRAVVPGGFATGSYERDQYRLAEFKPLWRAIGQAVGRKLPGDALDQISFGAHEYSAPPPMLGTAGIPASDRIAWERAQPSAWPDWNRIQANLDGAWHLARTEWALQEIAETTGVDPLQISVDVTESILDSMPDLERNHKAVMDSMFALNGGKGRGIKTWARYLQWAHPNWTWQRAYAEYLLWWEKTFPANYRSLCLFSWTYDAKEPLRWHQDYDHSELHELHQMWPEMVSTVHNGGGSETPVETYPFRAKITALPGNFLNIRSGDSAAYADVGDLNVGDVITVLSAGRKDGNGQWREMTRASDNKQGWFADLNDGVKWDALPEPEPEPEPEPPPTEPGDPVTHVITLTLHNVTPEKAEQIRIAYEMFHSSALSLAGLLHEVDYENETETSE
jgi:hypothetical protein